VPGDCIVVEATNLILDENYYVEGDDPAFKKK